MADLKNRFCWSFSQSKDFADCKRRHYWNRYGFWNGWKKDSSPEARTAYRLKQMQNKWSLIGNAVDLAIGEVIHRLTVGADYSYEMALDRANSYLRLAWMQHCSSNWRNNPKYSVCIREIYYSEITAEPSLSRDLWSEAVKTKTEACLSNFFDFILPRLIDLKPHNLLPVDHHSSGDPEHFYLDNVKIYAIPDCAYQLDDISYILDWKTGKERLSHQEQIKVYGLWAQSKLHKKKIKLFLEYLDPALSTEVSYTQDDQEEIYDFIHNSVQDMRQYLVNEDIEQNTPIEMAKFKKTDNLNACKICNYLELCDRGKKLEV